ncbi:hypothetical protein GVAV_002221 [Gurleya vavrai]
MIILISYLIHIKSAVTDQNIRYKKGLFPRSRSYSVNLNSDFFICSSNDKIENSKLEKSKSIQFENSNKSLNRKKGFFSFLRSKFKINSSTEKKFDEIKIKSYNFDMGNLKRSIRGKKIKNDSKANGMRKATSIIMNPAFFDSLDDYHLVPDNCENGMEYIENNKSNGIKPRLFKKNRKSDINDISYIN